MMKPILEIQNVSKKYRIQHLAGGYLSLRERMINVLKFERKQIEDFWALKDVSFEVQPGDTIGIVGLNGAGKSTLLKILSKITPPTNGKIISRGRIASLLEVGTGFHPELTGRENIFFNGSLLGMKKKEIQSKFDEIVDFSGVEKFLDTPLKHFSSGMQLRLAFAVAAFLEPEILIIDEVLAVGDSEFQKKCLGKMEDVNRSGRTILFVSHNIQLINILCSTGILLEKGRIINHGKMSQVTSAYISHSMNIEKKIIDIVEYTCDYFIIRQIKFNGSDSLIVTTGANLLVLEVDFDLLVPSVVELELHIKKHGEFLASFGNFLRHDLANFSLGTHSIRYVVNLPDLLIGEYSIDLNFTHPMKKNLATLENIILSEISEGQLRPVMNNELKNWSKIIMSGELSKR